MSKIEKNLTEGSVVKQLILFALPFMLSNLIQSLYNVADMLIVGRFCGPVGISGVNIGGQVTFLMTNLVIGLSVGGTVVIAQFLGCGDRKAVRECIGTLLTSLIAAAVLMTTVMLLVSDQILKLIQTPAESFAQARSYLDITIMGTVFIFGYNALSAIMRGMGDSKRPLYFVAIACVCNIFLDLLLVGVFRMEAKGAAIATVVSQAISMLLCILYLKKADFIFDFKISSFCFKKDRFATLMKVGIPTSIQNMITNVSFLVLTTLVNGFGVSASAAVGVVGKFNSFAILPAIAVGSSISAVAAQNIGAGEVERARKTFHIGTALAMAISLPIFVLARIFPAQIIELFDKDPEMIACGVTYMKSFTFDYIIAPFVFCLNGLITGAGHTTFASVNGILSALGFRIPFALLFGMALDMGLLGIGLGAPLGSLGAAVIAVVYYLSGKWKTSTVV